ncbi:UNVERIFIED_CONTAM: Chlorophyllase-2, chloroplastic [Sesamum radiatum]|uniref:Chlorophyllase-2, chloroplastic n=1 Tax=Sesamum radiatum TaxID=300843 RepID=A0AAW2UNQ1_SESRA
MSIPVAVIGTGYGNQSRGFLRPPCAPDGVNHVEFFKESKPPASYFLAKDYGHCDMLDECEDDLNAIVNHPATAPITLDPVIYVKE